MFITSINIPHLTPSVPCGTIHIRGNGKGFEPLEVDVK